MPFIHGKSAAITINALALTTFSTSVTFTNKSDTHDVTTFGKNAKVFFPGLTESTAKLEGVYDNTAATGAAAVLRPLVGAAATPLVFRPEGAGTGRPIATVQAIVSSYEESAPVADMVTFTAELQCSDAIVYTVSV